jgi:hypothetical protein
MKYKRKSPYRRVGRKRGNNELHSVGEWSRMLHSWWNKEITQKYDFKRKTENNN